MKTAEERVQEYMGGNREEVGEELANRHEFELRKDSEEYSAKVKAENAELRKQLNEALADKKRLEWLAKTRHSVSWIGRGIVWIVQYQNQTVGNVASNNDLRLAIDAAMKGQS